MAQMEAHAFMSLDEAKEFIRRHEIATNSKYLKNGGRKFDLQDNDLDTLKNHRMEFYGLRDEHLCQAMAELSYDGIPYVRLGREERFCQFGGYKRKQRLNEDETKRRKYTRPSKKINCPAKIWIRKIMKFPDYYLPPEKRTDLLVRNTCSRLRDEFGPHTKRYMQVFVQINSCHEHQGFEYVKRYRPRNKNSKKDKGCEIMYENDLDLKVRQDDAPVLRKLATLRNRDLSDIIMRFKENVIMPSPLAMPKANQRLEDMTDEQLVLLFFDLTGDTPNEIFNAAEKEFTTENLRLLLHLCIVFANNAGFQEVHPSVRIKGMENDYIPVECTDEDCPMQDSHMHCPFCSKNDSYREINLLKAHYKKRHIDKALEFSGLKILRCFDHCEMNTKNMPVKTFKGGHWHCYNCSTALDCRMNAMTHFQFHLSEYESSFVVHIREDVHQTSSCGTLVHEIQNVTGSRVKTNQPDHNSMEAYSATRTVSGEPLQYQNSGGHDENVMYIMQDEYGNIMESYTARTETTTTAAEPPVQERVVVQYADPPDVTQLKTKIQDLELKIRKLERENVLQKSLIGFLQRKNSDQVKSFDAEKEKLLEENAFLKGCSTILEDTPEDNDEVDSSGITADDSVADANARDNQPVNEVTEQPKMHIPISKPSLEQEISELRDMKKEFAELKNFLVSRETGRGFSIQNFLQQQKQPQQQQQQQLFFIPNQTNSNTPPMIYSLMSNTPLNFQNQGLNNSQLNLPASGSKSNPRKKKSSKKLTFKTDKSNDNLNMAGKETPTAADLDTNLEDHDKEVEVANLNSVSSICNGADKNAAAEAMETEDSNTEKTAINVFKETISTVPTANNSVGGHVNNPNTGEQSQGNLLFLPNQGSKTSGSQKIPYNVNSLFQTLDRSTTLAANSQCFQNAHPIFITPNIAGHPPYMVPDGSMFQMAGILPGIIQQQVSSASTLTSAPISKNTSPPEGAVSIPEAPQTISLEDLKKKLSTIKGGSVSLKRVDKNKVALVTTFSKSAKSTPTKRKNPDVSKGPTSEVEELDGSETTERFSKDDDERSTGVKPVKNTNNMKIFVLSATPRKNESEAPDGGSGDSSHAHNDGNGSEKIETNFKLTKKKVNHSSDKQVGGHKVGKIEKAVTRSTKVKKSS